MPNDPYNEQVAEVRTEGDGWEVVTMTGYRISHPYLARDPNCPKGRHPTRNCRCKVHKTEKEAWDYVDEQRALEAKT